MSAAIKRNWKTLVPLLTLLLAVLFGAGIFSRLRADDPPQYPVLLLDTNTQAFEHLAGVDQMFQFTLTEASDVVFFTTNASPDTALLLYGPDDATLLLNAHWPDLINSFRLLNQSGATALPAGTYYLSVSEAAGGIIPLPFAVFYFAYPTGTMPAATVPEPPVPVPPAEPATIPVLTLTTNAQTFTHRPGVDQTYQFTLTERSEVMIIATEASVDTALTLFGPDDATVLLNGHWPDYFTGLRVLDQTGGATLEPGTYYLTVSDLAGGLISTPFTVQYAVLVPADVSTATPALLMTPDAIEAEAIPVPMFTDVTNNLAEIVPTAEWQSFNQTIGTTQWVFFTFTQRTTMNVYLDTAGPNTRLVLYGPDSSTNLIGYAPPDAAAYWRVLDFSGETALEAGTYVLGVAESSAEVTTDTYQVWFTAAPATNTTTEGSPEGGPGAQAVATPTTTATTVNVTFQVSQNDVTVRCSNSVHCIEGKTIGVIE